MFADIHLILLDHIVHEVFFNWVKLLFIGKQI